MISKWLGEETFIKGVSQYLNKFKYGNAKTEDLWDALADASGKDVRSVMNIWTKKLVSQSFQLAKMVTVK